MDWRKALEGLLPLLGQVGFDAAVTELEKLTADADEPWKKTVLKLAIDAINANGMLGLQVAMSAILAMQEGEEPAFEDMDLALYSELLAHMQSDEADRKSATLDFLHAIGETLGAIVAAILAGVLSQVR